MDNTQKIEQLIAKTGCSYEDAKAALERCGWDTLDAVITLEREGKASTPASETKSEELIEITSEVSSDSISGDSCPQIMCSCTDDIAGEQGSAEGVGSSKKSPKRGRKLWKRIKSILINNRMLILKSNGQLIVDLPILVPVIALIAFFWATLILAVVAMALGCRFHFEGEDFGRTNINNTMDKATDYAEKIKNDLAGKVNDKQNTDN